jgi:hypothetical protein
MTNDRPQLTPNGSGFVAALRVELERAHRREQHVRPVRPRWTQHKGRVIAIAAASTLVVAGAAVAATDLFSRGTVIEGRTATEQTPDLQPPVARMSVDQTVAATGTSVAGPWQLRSHASERVADPETGEVYQPGGLGCVKLVLSTPPPGAATGAGMCGEETFLAGAHPVAADDQVEVLLYGRAPKDASKVALTGAGGVRIEVATREAPKVGRVWLINAPVGVRDAQVRWVGADGALGDPLDVSKDLQASYVDARLGR